MINGRLLKFKEVRVVGADGSPLGILQTRDALDLSREAGLDLVLVAPTAVPPVCKIVDHGKYKYETQKREKENRKKKQEVKGIKMSPRIAQHDLDTLRRHATKFLAEGNKLKVTCMFRMRELAHKDIGLKKMQMFAEAIADIAVVERPPLLEGRQMIMIISPKPGVKIEKPKAGKNDVDDAESFSSPDVDEHDDDEHDEALADGEEAAVSEAETVAE